MAFYFLFFFDKFHKIIIFTLSKTFKSEHIYQKYLEVDTRNSKNV